MDILDMSVCNEWTESLRENVFINGDHIQIFKDLQLYNFGFYLGFISSFCSSVKPFNHHFIISSYIYFFFNYDNFTALRILV